MTARILLVDENPSNTEQTQAMLGPAFYDVEHATSGSDAIVRAQASGSDLILIDVLTDRLDGYQLCQRLKAEAGTMHIPVVMFVPAEDADYRLQALAAGADDALAKPIDGATLLGRVRSLVRIKRTLDEWRLRDATAQALGLPARNPSAPDVPVAGTRALVVDHRDSAAMTVLDILSSEGIAPTQARTGIEALTLADTTPYDLIALSLSLPGDDPLQLIARMRADRRTMDIPLLMLAERDQQGLLARGFELGATDWAMDPVEGEELRMRARNQVRRKRYQDSLRQDLGPALNLAVVDPMTGLYNQRYLMRHLESLLAAGSPGGLAVMMIDIDHFEQVNDAWGQEAGDLALRQVGEALRSRIRVFDSLARYGGDEFVIVMTRIKDGDAGRAAERLRVAIQGMKFSNGQGEQRQLAISIGLTHSVKTATRPDMLLTAADRALFRAKQGGRNRVETEAASP